MIDSVFWIWICEKRNQVILFCCCGIYWPHSCERNTGCCDRVLCRKSKMEGCSGVLRSAMDQKMSTFGQVCPQGLMFGTPSVKGLCEWSAESCCTLQDQTHPKNLIHGCRCFASAPRNVPATCEQMSNADPRSRKMLMKLTEKIVDQDQVQLCTVRFVSINVNLTLARHHTANHRKH